MTVNTVRIRALNDAFRQTLVGGKLLMTCGVSALPEKTKTQLLERVTTFKNFDEGNDPHHEHDFGSIEIDGSTFYFKIDYYDRTMDYGSPDAADPAVTTRVMTLMQSAEY
jgi:major membrane immunogen (membrane-anchored lipoprotein)